VATLRDIAIFIGGSVLLIGVTAFALVVTLPFELLRVIKKPEA
jgi:hypothetical protein